ncbi:hypothetical protein FTUN_0931 [Frigoriglobus tundricola]|uniref:Uncharacterized protein n=1 Tax=Frigoriglobus tundricola TaxID=2774151 RepID=A0A6M5YH94_9BACT|nr:hypothetical protein FTUN_0931 [Frigoriglobus tundricola]
MRGASPTGSRKVHGWCARPRGERASSSVGLHERKAVYAPVRVKMACGCNKELKAFAAGK